jgi:hypothetical protein
MIVMAFVPVQSVLGKYDLKRWCTSAHYIALSIGAIVVAF